MAPQDPQASALRFLERVRSSFSHDLRTPLGVIANYAAVLASPTGSAPEDVRNIGQSIRGNAERASEMLAQLVEAIGLAVATPDTRSIDVLALARATLSEAGGRGSVRTTEDASGKQVTVDAGLLQYAWRAYLRVVVGCAREGSSLGLEVRTEAGERTRTIDLLRYEPSGAAETTVPVADEAFEEPAPFLRRTGTSGRTASGLALGLAKDLFVARGGDLATWGEPTALSALRVTLPPESRGR